MAYNQAAKFSTLPHGAQVEDKSTTLAIDVALEDSRHSEGTGLDSPARRYLGKSSMTEMFSNKPTEVDRLLVTHVSQRLADASSNTFRIADMPSLLQERLEEWDMDGDGTINKVELKAMIEDHFHSRSMNKQLRRLLTGMMIALVVLVGVLTGMTVGVVQSSKDTNVNSSNVLVSKSSNEPVQCANTDLQVTKGVLTGRDGKGRVVVDVPSFSVGIPVNNSQATNPYDIHRRLASSKTSAKKPSSPVASNYCGSNFNCDLFIKGYLSVGYQYSAQVTGALAYQWLFRVTHFGLGKGYQVTVNMTFPNSTLASSRFFNIVKYNISQATAKYPHVMFLQPVKPIYNGEAYRVFLFQTCNTAAATTNCFAPILKEPPQVLASESTYCGSYNCDAYIKSYLLQNYEYVARQTGDVAYQEFFLITHTGYGRAHLNITFDSSPQTVYVREFVLNRYTVSQSTTEPHIIYVVPVTPYYDQEAYRVILFPACNSATATTCYAPVLRDPLPNVIPVKNSTSSVVKSGRRRLISANHRALQVDSEGASLKITCADAQLVFGSVTQGVPLKVAGEHTVSVKLNQRLSKTSAILSVGMFALGSTQAYLECNADVDSCNDDPDAFACTITMGFHAGLDNRVSRYLFSYYQNPDFSSPTQYFCDVNFDASNPASTPPEYQCPLTYYNSIEGFVYSAPATCENFIFGNAEAVFEKPDGSCETIIEDPDGFLEDIYRSTGDMLGISGTPVFVRNVFEYCPDCKSMSMGGKCGVCNMDSELTEIVACFAGSENIQLSSGDVKPIANAQVGDVILAYSTDAKDLVYSEIIAIPHRNHDPNHTFKFQRIGTKQGRDLQLTADHLMPSGPCDHVSLPLSRAVDVKIGHCIQTVDGYEQVIFNHVSYSQSGIYTVVTQEPGYIVVNGVVASPFAVNHVVSNSFYSILRWWNSVFPLSGGTSAIIAQSLLQVFHVLATYFTK